MSEPVKQTIIRYLNHSGALVEVDKSIADRIVYSARCTACLDEPYPDTSLRQARNWAQTHSETCRALPQPETTDQ